MRVFLSSLILGVSYFALGMSGAMTDQELKKDGTIVLTGNKAQHAYQEWPYNKRSHFRDPEFGLVISHEGKVQAGEYFCTKRTEPKAVYDCVIHPESKDLL